MVEIPVSFFIFSLAVMNCENMQHHINGLFPELQLGSVTGRLVNPCVIYKIRLCQCIFGVVNFANNVVWELNW